MRNFNLFVRKIRFGIQRLIRGFDDESLWNLDVSLAKLILPRLTRFKEQSRARPGNLAQDDWDSMIDDMIFAFDWIANGKEWNLRQSDDERKDANNRVDKGLMLFGEYFQALWW